MTILRSNLYRILFKDSIFKYSLRISSPEHTPALAHLDQSDRQQLSYFLTTIDQYALTDLIHIYLPYEWPHQVEYVVTLLRGEELRVTIQPCRLDSREVERTAVLRLAIDKIMANTQFLKAKVFRSVFNSFDEKQVGGGFSETPGFSIELHQDGENLGIFLKPNILEINYNTSISEEGEIFVDITNGRFFEKTDVVRVQKKEQNQVLIHFRNREIAQRKNLKLALIRECVGYQLAFFLKKYMERIQTTSKELLKRWNISIDNKPVDMTLSFVDPGLIVLGKEIDKPLNNLIFPVTRNSYNVYYKMVFEVPFENFPDIEIVICVPERNEKIENLRKSMQIIKERMNLKLNINVFCIQGKDEVHWSNFLNGQLARGILYMIVLPRDLSKQNINFIKENLVRQGVLFDLLRQSQLSETDASQNEVTALQHLGVICSKFRQAPWRLRLNNLSFARLPLSVVSLNVQKKKNGLYSVSLVFSLNAFLSKFTSEICQATEQKLLEVTASSLLKCLGKFAQIHKIFPVRLFVFVLGQFPSSPKTLYDYLQTCIQGYYNLKNNTKISYLTVVKLHPSETIRLFSQNNTAIISDDTVKPAGLLSYLVTQLVIQLFNNRMYIQLQYFEPITEFQVVGEKLDQQFYKSLSQLIVKLAFGSVGGRYAGGFGFMGFAKKLNAYKQFDVARAWQKYLHEGNMIYL